MINSQTNHIEVAFATKPNANTLKEFNRHGLKWASSKKHWYGPVSEFVQKAIDRYTKLSGTDLSISDLEDLNKFYAEFSDSFPEAAFIRSKITEAIKQLKSNQLSSAIIEFPTKVPDGGSIKKYTVIRKKKTKPFKKIKADKIQISFTSKPSSKTKAEFEREGFEFINTKKAVKKSYPTLNGIEVFPDSIQVDAGMDGVTNEKVYDIINKMLIKAMESKQDLPWRKPWKSMETYGAAASNFVTKKAYRGVNSFLLNFIIPLIRKKEWNLPYFMTFNQVDKLGGKVKKGAKGYEVTYFQMVYKLGNKTISEQEYWSKYVDCLESKKDYCKELRSIPILRYYKVFNADDIEGINWGIQPIEPKSEVAKIETAEAIWDAFPKKAPKLVFKDPNAAFYTSMSDTVNMPPMESFESEAFYYGTFFHELVHSTGHSSRLKRKLGNKFGSKDYSYEELIAELGACYLNGESGILYHTLNNNAAYLKGWKKSLKKYIKEDEKFFFSAASKAQEAADFILQPNDKGVPAYLRKVTNPQLKLALSGTSKKSKPASNEQTTNNSASVRKKSAKPNKAQQPSTDQTAKKAKPKKLGATYTAPDEIIMLSGTPELSVPKIEVSYNKALAKNLPKGFKIDDSAKVADFLRSTFEPGTIELQEMFVVIFLDHALHPIGWYRHSMGTRNETTFDDDIVLAAASESMSYGVILAHNHPSGDVTPSEVDIQLTNQFIERARALGIQVVDHVILGKNDHYSFADHQNAEKMNGYPMQWDDQEDIFIRADQADAIKAPEVFRLNASNPLYEVMGRMQPHRLSILIEGPTHTLKSELKNQLVDAFAEIGKKVVMFDLEHGGLQNKDTKESVDRNIKPKNKQRVAITGYVPNSLDELIKYTKNADVIVVDSWQKLKEAGTRFDELRMMAPEKIWIVVFQQNAKGTTRGGSAPAFDTTIHLVTGKDDYTPESAYVTVEKNRGNRLGMKYYMISKRVLTPEEQVEE